MLHKYEIDWLIMFKIIMDTLYLNMIFCQIAHH